MRGSFLEPPENRRVATVAMNILYGAAVLTRAGSLSIQGRRPARAACRGLAPLELTEIENRLFFILTYHASSPARRRRMIPAARARPHSDVRKGKDLNSSDPSPPVPVAIIGMGCMFPQAEDLARYWANIRKGVDAITEVPESHWRVADYFDSDPKAPDRTYAHRGGFLTPVDFPLLDFGIAPTFDRGDRHHPACSA